MTTANPMPHRSIYPSTFYRVSLKAVIRDEQGRVLVVKENATSWSLPGGGWDHGETEHEVLARELKEEVGYAGNFTATPRATHVWWVESKQAYLLWIVYDVTTESMNFTVGADASEIAFMDPQEFAGSESRAEQWIAEHL